MAFTIFLRGMEQVYGGDDPDEEHVFFEKRLFHKDRLDQKSGTLNLEIPDKPLSFEGSRRRILWRIDATRVVKGGRTIEDCFEIPVFPQISGT